MLSFRSLALAYLPLQGLAAVGWWVGLFAVPEWRRAFLAPGAPDVTLLAFLAADAVLFVGGSWLSAWWIARDDARRAPALWCTFGAIAYGALYTIGLSVMTGAAWLGAVAMTLAMIATLVIAWRCG